MKILCLGHASYDFAFPVDSFPVENIKYRLTEKTEGGGGPASNAAYLLGKWQQQVYFAGMVGNDVYGQRIKKEFESVNVNTEYLETNYENDTSISFILINKTTGSRTVFNVPGKYMPLKKNLTEINPDLILIDGHDFISSKKIIENCPNAITIIDAGRYNDEVVSLCKKVKYVVCSKKFAEEATKKQFNFDDTNTLVTIYQEMKEKFSGEVIITLENKGVLYSIDKNIKLLPALNVPTNDSTAAGDIFHGAFAYGIANGFDLDKTIKIANIAAGISVSRVGARNSIPMLEEVLSEYEK